MRKLIGLILPVLLALSICRVALAAPLSLTAQHKTFSLPEGGIALKETYSFCNTAKNVLLQEGTEYFEIQWDSKGNVPFPRGRVIKLEADTQVSAGKTYPNGFILFSMNGLNYVTYKTNVKNTASLIAGEGLDVSKATENSAPAKNLDEEIQPKTGDTSSDTQFTTTILLISIGALAYAIKKRSCANC